MNIRYCLQFLLSIIFIVCLYYGNIIASNLRINVCLFYLILVIVLFILLKIIQLAYKPHISNKK
jgi:hypothetical protein